MCRRDASRWSCKPTTESPFPEMSHTCLPSLVLVRVNVDRISLWRASSPKCFVSHARILCNADSDESKVSPVPRPWHMVGSGSRARCDGCVHLGIMVRAWSRSRARVGIAKESQSGHPHQVLKQSSVRDPFLPPAGGATASGDALPAIRPPLHAATYVGMLWFARSLPSQACLPLPAMDAFAV